MINRDREWSKQITKSMTRSAVCSCKANARSDLKEILSVFHVAVHSSLSRTDFYIPIKISPRWHEQSLRRGVRISWKDALVIGVQYVWGYLPTSKLIPVSGFLQPGVLIFFIFSAQRGTTNNITKAQTLTHTHTQFCFFLITHNALFGDGNKG